MNKYNFLRLLDIFSFMGDKMSSSYPANKTCPCRESIGHRDGRWCKTGPDGQPDCLRWWDPKPVSELPACTCRAAKGEVKGWCGVAGGGVPGCDH